MQINFQGKNIVVTGAGQGIGRALCEQLDKCGANVYAFSRSPGPLAELKQKCPKVVTHSVDVSDWDAVIDAMKTLQGIPIHGLVNNAGVSSVKPFLQVTNADLDFMFNINFKGAFSVTQQVVPLLVDGASIVNVSSLASLLGVLDHSAYSASKAALDSLTKTLAMELAPRRIRVNSVNPTVILGPKMGAANWADPARAEWLLNRIPLHRFGELREVVEPIIFYLSDRSSYANGHIMPLEGGLLVG